MASGTTVGYASSKRNRQRGLIWKDFATLYPQIKALIKRKKGVESEEKSALIAVGLYYQLCNSRSNSGAKNARSNHQERKPIRLFRQSH
jgi:hypothetical protein